MTDKTYAPWSAEEVDKLNEFQRSGVIHPFTCGGGHPTGGDPVLVATRAGWVCTHCSYEQNWAHDFMLEGAPRDLAGEMLDAASQSQISTLTARIAALEEALKPFARAADAFESSPDDMLSYQRVGDLRRARAELEKSDG